MATEKREEESTLVLGHRKNHDTLLYRKVHHDSSDESIYSHKRDKDLTCSYSLEYHEVKMQYPFK